MAGRKKVLAALQQPRALLQSAMPSVPAVPGLYAIFGDDASWNGLRLGDHQADRPLYVGKAEDSMVKRDLRTHFGDGRTGSSTVRRSFAALLRDALGLRGIPRNTAKPGYFSNFGLSPEDDAKLTRWMRDRLQLATWPWDGSGPLVQIEREILQEWNPPLNIVGVEHEWRAFVLAERRVMAEQARLWTPSP